MSTETKKEGSDSGGQGPDRRQHCRVGTNGRLSGCLLSDSTTVTVLEIGRRGFSMRLGRACAADEVYDVQFSSAACSPVVLTARVVHAMRANIPDRPAEYFAGLEFVDSGMPRVEQAIDKLVASLRESSLDE